jgi:hypothetical protein
VGNYAGFVMRATNGGDINVASTATGNPIGSIGFDSAAGANPKLIFRVAVGAGLVERMRISSDGSLSKAVFTSVGVVAPPFGGAWAVLGTLEAGNFVGATIHVLGAENGNINTTYSRWPAVYTPGGWALGAEYAKINGGNGFGAAAIRITGNNIEVQSLSGFQPTCFCFVEYVRG